MDIVAHGLWAGLGVRWLKRRHQVNRSTAAACIALSMAPDIAHFVPVAVWAMFGSGSMESLLVYVSASPGGEPLMPESTALWSHHLHCVMHSAVVAAVVTVILWPWRTHVAVALAGWWLHIVIDVFTHSADFYPVPILYPITQRGFDGLAWNTPWFLVTNYVALAVCTWVLFRQRRK